MTETVHTQMMNLLSAAVTFFVSVKKHLFVSQRKKYCVLNCHAMDTHTHVCTAILVMTLIDIMHFLAPYPNLNLILTLTLRPNLNPQKAL